MIGLLVADESKALPEFGLLHSDVFNFTILTEEIMKLSISPMLRKVPDVEIVPLFGILVPQELLLLDHFSICFLESRSQKEFVVFRNFFFIESFDSFIGTLRSILLADVLWVIEANETVLAYFIFHQDQRLDLTKRLEQFSDFVHFHVRWNVFEIYVIDQLPELASIFGLEDHGDDLVIILCVLHSLSSCILVIEANEAVATTSVVLVERDLQAFHFSVLREHVLQVLVTQVLGNVADEHIVLTEFLSVVAQQVPVKLQRPTLLAIDGEVAHLLTSCLVLFLVFDVDDARVEGPRHVLFDLRSSLKQHASLLLENHGQLAGAGEVFWEII